MPIVVLIGGGLILWRATEKASDEVAEIAVQALPWAAGALGLYLILRGR